MSMASYKILLFFFSNGFFICFGYRKNLIFFLNDEIVNSQRHWLNKDLQKEKKSSFILNVDLFKS